MLPKPPQTLRRRRNTPIQHYGSPGPESNTILDPSTQAITISVNNASGRSSCPPDLTLASETNPHSSMISNYHSYNDISVDENLPSVSINQSSPSTNNPFQDNFFFVPEEYSISSHGQNPFLQDHPQLYQPTLGMANPFLDYHIDSTNCTPIPLNNVTITQEHNSDNDNQLHYHTFDIIANKTDPVISELRGTIAELSTSLQYAHEKIEHLLCRLILLEKKANEDAKY